MVVPLLPAPLFQSVRSLKQKRGGLRPAFVEAHGHLIDLAELFLAFHTATVCAGLAQRGEGASPEFCRNLQDFLNAKLNPGHWLGLWKRSADELLVSGVSESAPATPVARMVRTHVVQLDTLPPLRNKHRGHTYTPSVDEAQQTIAQHEPTLAALLAACSPWFDRWALTWCVEVEGTTAELGDLTDVATVDESSNAWVVESGEPLIRNAVYLVDRAAAGSGSLKGEAVLPLAPFLTMHEGGLAVFQGSGGAGRAKYLSLSPRRGPDGGVLRESQRPLAEVYAAITGLLPAPAAVAARTGRKAPAWAHQLTCHDVLCEAEVEGKTSSAADFFHGNAPSWADLRDDLDIRRTLRDRHGAEVSPEVFDAQCLREFVARARCNDAPLVLFLAPAGSGKTTHLLRTAFEMWRRFDTAVRVLRHHWGIGGLPSLRDLEIAHENERNRVLVLVFDEAGQIAHHLDGLRRNLQHRRIPAVLLCAERPNLWPAVVSDCYEIQPQLTPNEAVALLTRLETHGQLGCLAGLSPDARHKRLLETWDGQILVSLREATEGRRFDEIIQSEYGAIPTRAGKDVYLTAALVHRCGLALPPEVAYRVAGVDDARAFREVHQACKGALVSQGEGWVRTRHRRIAELLCEEVLPAASAQIEDLAFALGASGADHLGWVAQVLAAPETEPLLLASDLSLLLLHLRGLGTQLDFEVVWQALELSGWQARGVVRFAAAHVMGGIHIDTRLNKFSLGKLFRALAKLDGKEAAVDMVRTALSKSTSSDNRTDELTQGAMSALDALGRQPEALQLVRSEIERAHSLKRTPLGLYTRLGEYLRSQGHLDEAESAVLTGIGYLTGPNAHSVNLYACLVDTRVKMGRDGEALDAAWEGINHLRASDDPSAATHQMWTRILKIKRRLGEALAAVMLGFKGLEESRRRGEAGDELLGAQIGAAAAEAEEAGTLCEEPRERLLLDPSVRLAVHARVAGALLKRGQADLGARILNQAWTRALESGDAGVQQIAIVRAEAAGSDGLEPRLEEARAFLDSRGLAVEAIDGALRRLRAPAAVEHDGCALPEQSGPGEPEP